MYKITKQTFIGETYSIQRDTDDAHIPLSVENSDYQKFLYDVIDNGQECYEGELSEEMIQHVSDTQLKLYKSAIVRLEQYILSEGHPDVMGVGMVEGTEIVIEAAVEPLPEFVTVTVGETTEEIRNPLIVKDEEERAAAQAIVDATPQAVKDAA